MLNSSFSLPSQVKISPQAFIQELMVILQMHAIGPTKFNNWCGQALPTTMTAKKICNAPAIVFRMDNAMNTEKKRLARRCSVLASASSNNVSHGFNGTSSRQVCMLQTGKNNNLCHVLILNEPLQVHKITGQLEKMWMKMISNGRNTNYQNKTPTHE